MSKSAIYLRHLLIVALLLFVSACATMTTVRQSHSYDRAHLHRGTILVLPPEASVSMVGFLGKGERMENYEYHLEKILGDSLLTTLRDNGYEVKLITNKEIHDRKLTGKVLDLKDKYQLATRELYKKPTEEEQKANSIDLVVGNISELNKSDKNTYLLICEYTGTSKTTGARVASLLMDSLIGTRASGNAESSNILIGIVDNKDGKFYWSNINSIVKGTFHSMFSGSDKDQDHKHSRELVGKTLDPITTSES